MSGPKLRRPTLAGLLLLAFGTPSGWAAPALEARLDPEAMVGRLVVTPAEHVLSAREGWAVDEIYPVEQGRVVVIWSSLPRRQYLRPELWVQEGEGARQVWPAADAVVDWYQAEVRLRRTGDASELLVRRALVGENFDAPLLYERKVLRVAGDAMRLVGRRTEKVLTPTQRLNEVAALVADGAHDEALRMAADLVEPEYQTRATVLLAPAAPPEGANRFRQELVRRAQRPDAAGRVAAEALLRWKLRETPSAP